MQTKESLNEVLSRKVVEEFTLPSGKEARRFHFSARDAMNIQKEFAARNSIKAESEVDSDDFQLLIICKCVQIKNASGEFESLILEDFDTDKIDGFDYITLFGKIAGLTDKKGEDINPK